ncbi:MAG: hypothetical protein M3335_07110 [Actinomycetota bacterium]|nr:hypothetical protein [Actinomycetota bacterium]
MAVMARENQVNGDIRELRADIKDLRGEMNQRLEEMNDSMNQRFDSANVRFDAMYRTMVHGFIAMSSLMATSFVGLAGLMIF